MPTTPIILEDEYQITILERRTRAAGCLHEADALQALHELRLAWARIDMLEGEDPGPKDPICPACHEECHVCKPPEPEAVCGHCGETCKECSGGVGDDY